ncbi:MAG: DUF1015 domain-containing protein [Chloroflexi bacterium]|nr:DUF1015 domain-containing protein [Chloroflexota bacterium]
MVDIRPFPGIRYDTTKAGSLDQLVCPPYDIIAPAEREALYARSPYNIVRIESGVDRPEGTPEDNRYAHAKADFDAWLAAGVLRRDPRPALYLTHHEFTHRSSRCLRRALVAAVRLEEFEKGIVRPHERTHEGPKQDRLRLMQALHANVSPVMGLYEDADGGVASIVTKAEMRRPDVVFTEPSGDLHRLWVIPASTLCNDLRKAFAERPLYIADGHHRYETALYYRNLRHEAEGENANPDAAYNFVFMALISMSDPGLLALPYYRVLRGIDQRSLLRLPTALGQDFTVQEVEIGQDTPEAMFQRYEEAVAPLRRERQIPGLHGPGRQVIGLYAFGGDRVLALTVRDDASVLRAGGHSLAWRCLGPCLFQIGVMEPLLALSEEEAQNRGLIDYLKDGVEAVRRVLQGNDDLAVLLDPVPMPLLKAVADARDRLPPKSTYFYPKLPTGLVLNPLDGVLP